ncbi:hypothetical protein LTS18_001239, partial [Coniosporium uncinatum]
VSSKATLNAPLGALLPRIPSLLHESIRNCRYYARKSDSLVIQADDSRKQSDNVQSCLVKLHNMIVDAAAALIPGETSEAQRDRVKKL